MKLTDYFERNARDKWSKADNMPEWLYEAIREAHDGEWPDDWRWDTCYAICDNIDDGETDPSSIADGLADVYTSDLIAWLAADASRAEYVDEAYGEFGPGKEFSVVAAIGLGQYLCIEQMASILLAAVNANADDEDEGDEDEDDNDA